MFHAEFTRGYKMKKNWGVLACRRFNMMWLWAGGCWVKLLWQVWMFQVFISSQRLWIAWESTQPGWEPLKMFGQRQVCCWFNSHNSIGFPFSCEIYWWFMAFLKMFVKFLTWVPHPETFQKPFRNEVWTLQWHSSKGIRPFRIGSSSSLVIGMGIGTLSAK